MDLLAKLTEVSGGNLIFTDPITDEDLYKIKRNTGVEVSGDLLNLLKQTNGIIEKPYGWYFVFHSDEIIERHYMHFDETSSHHYLFFSDNGCGECFGFVVQEGKIISNQVGVYYPIGKEFHIVAPDFSTWAIEWYTGKLKT